MPRLSIVIPWNGPSGPFEDTLAAVLQNRPSGSEVIVALAHPYDDPYGLGDEVSFVAPRRGSATDLVSLCNCGVEAATAPVVELVPAGLQVTEGWTSAALLHFAEHDVAAVAPVILSNTQAQRVVSAGVNFTAGGARQLAHAGESHNVSALVQSRPLAAPLAGGFFRKSVVTALGGFDALLGEHAADLDLALCTAQLSLRTECEPTSILTTASITNADGSFSAGRALEQLFWRHLPAGERATRSRQHYLRCVAEGCYGLMQPKWLARAAGRAAGWLGSLRSSATAERIASAREQLAGLDAPQILSLQRGRPATADRPARRAA